MLALLPALFGCAAGPVTNGVFLEDASFLAVLPAESDLAPPDALAVAPTDPCELLDGAIASADELAELIAPILTAADAVRDEIPDERSDVHRRWDPVTVATTTADGVALWWVTAEIVRPEGGPTVATIAAADAADGEFAPIASGTLLEDGSKAMSWDLSAIAALIGTEATGTLDADIGPGEEFERVADLSIDGPDGLPTGTAWSLLGTDGFAYSGFMAVTDDGADLPGWTFVVQTDGGGRARGQVWRETEALDFDACWNASGQQVWLDGDAGIAGDGSESACPVAAFPD